MESPVMRRLLNCSNLILKQNFAKHPFRIVNAACRSSDTAASSPTQPTVPAPSGLYGQPDFSTHPHLVGFGDVTPHIKREEYQKRRENLMELIKTHSSQNIHNHIALIPSATKLYMSADIPYPFRQNTDFLYLSGFMEPDSLLMLENKPGVYSSEVKSTLFVPKKDPSMELWDGPRSGTGGSVILTGVDQAYNIDELEAYMNDYKHNTDVCVWYDSESPNNARFHQTIIDTVLLRNWVDKVEKLRLLVHKLRVVKSAAECDLMEHTCYIGAQAMRDVMRYTAPKVDKVEKLRPLVHKLRVVKSAAECDLMEHTCYIGAQAMRDVMRYTAPKTDESFIHALFEYQCRIKGAQYLSYPPVVASGNRANIIHYISNDQVVEERDLVLVDAGCETFGYSSDLTRTYPASGEFMPQHIELYEALLWVQEQLVLQSCVGSSIALLYHNMIANLAQQLKQLGIIAKHLEGDELSEAVKRYCPHDVGHYIGMDIHDTPTVSRHTPLIPGMIITVEPGIYIPESDLKVPAEWRGVGIRIEDDILITEKLPKNLTAFAPKTVEEVETAMINTC